MTLKPLFEWRKARKKPIEVEFREVHPPSERIQTREGELSAYPYKDYIIRGVEGEIYPIGKEIFRKSYDVLC